ncbi:MAG: hypothetical protein IJT04_00745 [Bacteroidales bacterium]|nr:hypothetical protein [Bacteroidales bacterium]
MKKPYITNPWKNISWKKTVADDDETVIYPAFCDVKGIDIADLPEPYTGNIDSNVVFLSMNPGAGSSNRLFRFHKQYLQLTRETLNHSIGKSMWDEKIRCHNEGLHEGCIWWRERTAELRKAIAPTELNVFVLEYFPYHTANTIKFPKLPSDTYRNYLLCQAIDEGKLIVMLRGEKLWTGIMDKCCDEEKIGKKLLDYKNLIKHQNPRNIYFTQNNFKSEDWKKLIEALKKPIVQKHKIITNY